MIVSIQITLVYKEQPVHAQIITLTPELVEHKVSGSWWDEDCLKNVFKAQPIDQHWDWNSVTIEYEGRTLQSEKSQRSQVRERT